MASRGYSMPGRELVPLLTTVAPNEIQEKAAWFLVMVSLLIFVVAVPFAKAPLVPCRPFLAAYESAYVMIAAVTAVLLLGQFRANPEWAMLILAGGYIFEALMAVAHMLSFPGLFATGGVIGGGEQTTAWLYFIWHGGFPVFVFIYAALKGRQRNTFRSDEKIGRSTAIVLGTVFFLVTLAVLSATHMHSLLPTIMRGDVDASLKVRAALGAWVINIGALLFLWPRRRNSVLNLWLMVVVSVGIFDTGLSSVFNHARFDLGWYLGRVYGLVAISVLLLLLLLENSTLYLELARQRVEESRRNRERLAKTAANFRAVFGAMPDGAALIGRDRRIRRVNPAFSRLWGYSQDEVEGKTMAFLSESPVGGPFAGDGGNTMSDNNRSMQKLGKRRTSH